MNNGPSDAATALGHGAKPTSLRRAMYGARNRDRAGSKTDLYRPVAVVFLIVSRLGFSPEPLAGQHPDPDPYAGYSHYDLELTFDDDSKTFIGTERVLFINTFPRPIDSIYFFISNFAVEKNPYVHDLVNDLGYVGGFHPSGTQVTGAFDADGRPLPFAFVPAAQHLRFIRYSGDRQFFYVALPRPLPPGGQTELRIDFRTVLPNVYSSSTAVGDGMKWRYRDQLALLFSWYPLEANRGRDTWSLGALMSPGHFVDTLELTLPDRYAVVVTGDDVRETVADGLKTVVAVDHHPVVTKAVILTAVHRVVSAVTADGVRINVWYLPSAQRSQAERILSYSLEILERYNASYGETGHQKIDIVNTPFMSPGGFASEGVVVLTDALFSTAQVLAPGFADRLYYYLTAHELAHLWAGVSTTANTYEESYLHGGVAAYMSHEAFEAKFPTIGNTYQLSGAASYLLTLVTERPPVPFTLRDWSLGSYLRSHRDGWDQALVTPHDEAVYNASFVRVHQKGHLVVQMLEAYVGKEVLRQALRDYFTAHRHRAVTTADLQVALERASGKDLGAFFRSWVYTAGHVDYSVGDISRAERDGQHITTVAIAKRGDAVTPLEVELVLEGGRRERLLLAEVLGDTTVTIHTAQRARGVILDPEARLLETNRRNNKTVDNLDFYVFGDARKLTTLRVLENYFVGLYPAPQLHAESDTTEIGIGLQLRGREYLRHHWTLGAAPVWRARSETGLSSPSYRLFGDITFLGPRDASLTVSATHHGRHGFSGELATWYPFFQRIEAGTYAHVYHPAHQLRLAVVRADSQHIRPLHYVTVELTEDWLPKHGLIGRLTLEASPRIAGLNDYRYVKASVGLTKHIRLAPMLLVPSMRLGLGDGIPHSRRFRLDGGEAAMRGYTKAEDGDAFGRLTLDWVFPVVFGLKENVLNLAVFRGLAAALFMEVGDVWDRSAEPVAAGTLLDDAKINAGVEVSLVFTSVADVLVPLTFGYGRNLWNVRAGKVADSGQFYVRFDTPVTLFARRFGY